MSSRGWERPRYSKSRVKKAGKRIRNNQANEEDWAVLDNWRRSHAYVLNTFQMRLRSTRKRFCKNAGIPIEEIQVAQRHKRLPTIVNKLEREPTMQLDTMQDIAGCRVILPDLDSLKSFRRIFHQTRAKHKHINAGSNRYDYIMNPKSSGYRGVHDVYETRLDSESGSRWNGLRVEIQFRTRVQHAWATAVETVDLLTGERAKFGQANPKLQSFFALASELLARAHENAKGPMPDMSDDALIEKYQSLDSELGIIERLTRATKQNPSIKKGKHVILIFNLKGEKVLEVHTYDSIGPAQSAYTKFEQELAGKADIVLVKAERTEELKRAFQNYFTDAKDFIDLLNAAVTKLNRATKRSG